MEFLPDRRKSCSTARELIIMFECRARACYSRNEIQMYKIPRKTSNFPWDYLLFANLNSTVPSYADEFKLTKYNFLFRNLPACRWVYRHAERNSHGVSPSKLFILFLQNQFYNYEAYYKQQTYTHNYYATDKYFVLQIIFIQNLSQFTFFHKHRQYKTQNSIA